MRKSLVLLLLCFLILCFGCTKPAPPDAGSGDSTEKVEKKEGKTGEEKKDTDAVPVRVISPHMGDISSFLIFSSNVDAEKVVDIFPMTSGIIEKILKDEGDKVQKGTVLAVLDDREASIEEERAEINYKKLQAEFERMTIIFEKKIISKEEYDRVRYQMESAKLDWKQRKLFLSYTRITSPISGVVTKRHIKEGNKIGTTQLSFSVVQNKEKIAVVNIPESEKDSLHLKQKAFIICGKTEIPAMVKRISPAIDAESGTFKVTVALEDKKDQLAVGQFGNVRIVKDVHKNAVLLTKEALIYEGGKVYVFIVDKEMKALKKLITPGFDDGKWVEIIRGLNAQDRVVTDGKSSLKNKTLVKIIEPLAS
ncbi:MAG: efflux RND transporter periplasmic adaptor subunit [bacterium]|nr:efflux RND transporter periplasmic adaptor subunit [bacterium]